jgi:hypothetical protein
MAKPREVMTVCLHLRAFGCEQCKAVLKQYEDALRHCAEALQAIGQSKGLVADHGDALDEALKILHV